MKKYIYLLSLFCLANFTSAQMKIGENNKITNSSVLLEFDNLNGANKKGIVLPVYYMPPSRRSLENIKNGTFVVDYASNQIKVYENDKWVFLTPTDRNILRKPIRNDDSNNIGKGVLITDDKNVSENYESQGGLELVSETKALVLPHIKNPHLNVTRPIMGFMCYDTVTESIAMFDGTYWHYWK
ncbi:hypothetical protein [Faecalibacter macacae]|nr:hypothetical protein [Faecalibacter macacae]